MTDENATDRRRTALVTGANRGIGRAVATELHRRNLRVVVTARNAEDARAAAAEIGPDASAHPLDVTDPDSVRRCGKEAGPVDILVCNAGVLLDAGTDPLTVPLELVERTLLVNLLGTWRVVQEFVPPMVRRGWGRVLIMSSGTTAEFGGRLFLRTPGYSISKSALNGLMTMLAVQTEGTGVLVNALNPGRIRTRMMPGQERRPEDVAPFIAAVASSPPDEATGRFFSATRDAT
jgi:NAD(P)-dependent dehydrogenase (short-subunit alcohol dehydrogenase family)